jgi:exosortase
MVKNQKNVVIFMGYCFIIFALIFLIFKNNFIWLWHKWMEETRYSHGPMIPIISLYIVYQKKDAIKNITFHSANLGLLILFLACILFFISTRAQISFVQTYSMILFIVGVVWYIFGKDAFIKLWFPIFYLIFMVPFWAGGVNRLSNFLKTISSISSAKVFQFLGTSVFRDGVTLHFSKGVLEVADPCSGIQSLISLMAIGVVIAYFSTGSVLKKFFITFLVFPLVYLGNTVRIIVLGFFLETTGAMVSDTLHTLIGMMIFIFMIFLLFGFSKWNNI